MRKARLAMVLLVAVAALSLAGCYVELASRDFSKVAGQSLDGWHVLPFANLSFTSSGLQLGRATFSAPLLLGEEFEIRLEMSTKLGGKDLEEFGVCLSQGKIYFSPVGKNIVIRTQSLAGKASYEAYGANFVVKTLTYESGDTLLPGFRTDGSNVLTVWKKGTSFGWNLNGSKKGPFTMPAEFQNNVYVHFNINGPIASEGALAVRKIRVTGPKGSAVAW